MLLSPCYRQEALAAVSPLRRPKHLDQSGMEQMLPSTTISTLGQTQMIYWGRLCWLLESELSCTPMFSQGVLIHYTPEVVTQEGRQLPSQNRAQCEACPSHLHCLKTHFCLTDIISYCLLEGSVNICRRQAQVYLHEARE